MANTLQDKVVIIGGGIIGLSCAYYLRLAGREVCVVDRGDMLEGCSYGNAGYVSPSHFVPMAAPGVLGNSLKWMLNPKSPLFVEPRLSWDLISWGVHFLRNANSSHVNRSMGPMRDILMLSRSEYAKWASLPGFSFAFDPCGMLQLYQDPKLFEHAPEHAKQGQDLGLGVKVLSGDEAQKLEPNVRMNVAGALFFSEDAQLYPNQLMASLLKWLPEQGVELLKSVEVKGFETVNGKVTSVVTASGKIPCAQVVLATGAWSKTLGKQLGLNLQIVAGRGYSMTFNPAPVKFLHSVILEDAHVAVSPMDSNKLRIGGTMEITRTGRPPRMERVKGIVEGVNRFFPELKITLPSLDQVWHGYRPVSMDGLPFIGRSPLQSNVVVAAGHAMLGLSMGPATGKLVAELITGNKTSVNLSAFRVGR